MILQVYPLYIGKSSKSYSLRNDVTTKQLAAEIKLQLALVDVKVTSKSTKHRQTMQLINIYDGDTIKRTNSDTKEKARTGILRSSVQQIVRFLASDDAISLQVDGMYDQ